MEERFKNYPKNRRGGDNIFIICNLSARFDIAHLGFFCFRLSSNLSHASRKAGVYAGEQSTQAVACILTSEIENLHGGERCDQELVAVKVRMYF